MALKERILSGQAEIGVMGLGYVGLTEAIELAKAGFRVTGFDVDASRVKAVMTGSRIWSTSRTRTSAV